MSTSLSRRNTNFNSCNLRIVVYYSRRSREIYKYVITEQTNHANANPCEPVTQLIICCPITSQHDYTIRVCVHSMCSTWSCGCFVVSCVLWLPTMPNHALPSYRRMFWAACSKRQGPCDWRGFDDIMHHKRWMCVGDKLVTIRRRVFFSRIVRLRIKVEVFTARDRKVLFRAEFFNRQM